jgi:hypothetical protein
MSHYGWILAFLLASPAFGAQNLLCTRAEPMPGASSYLLVVPEGENATAIILDANFSIPDRGWQVAFPAAPILRQDESLIVTGAEDFSRIDWNSPEHQGQCYVSGQNLDFTLNQTERETSGVLKTQMVYAMNPNPGHPCPLPAPGIIMNIEIRCSNY